MRRGYYVVTDGTDTCGHKHGTYGEAMSCVFLNKQDNPELSEWMSDEMIEERIDED